MLTVLLVIALVVVAAIALLVGRALWATRHARRRLRELGALRHREVALLLGRASSPRDAKPAVGTLVRTDDAVALVPATRGQEVLIPLDTVTAASATTSFRGRTYAEPVLLVTWEQHGTGDAAVLKVADPDAWVEELSRPR
ncbi:hypothetical protein [Aeromicrobium sp. Leaf350]|uniref:hypothetical protein n=1 Tax=Aeromicrobium sp. Leaf350 TaxID=2876565 RepID=UPI001E5CF14A|nr:hypothetical protein [Aeromicrobium sp. Leaf350]